MCETFAELCANDDWNTVVAVLQPLLDLQNIDTAMLQLRHRVATLTERTSLITATSVGSGLKKEIVKVTVQQKSAQRDIDALEASNKIFEAAIAKFGKQLKTIIAPREAEVLQHEIAMATEERSLNDDRELILLEIAEQFDRRLVELTTQLTRQEKVIEQANQSLTQVIAECDLLHTELDAKRASAVSAVDPKLVLFYESKRSRKNTAVIADLHGATCQSCHLDLSKVELSVLKKLPESELPECPNCDCLLVL